MRFFFNNVPCSSCHAFDECGADTCKQHMQAQIVGVKLPHLDGLGQEVPALLPLVEAEDGLVDIVICDVTGSNGASSGFLQHGKAAFVRFMAQKQTAICSHWTSAYKSSIMAAISDCAEMHLGLSTKELPAAGLLEAKSGLAHSQGVVDELGVAYNGGNGVLLRTHIYKSAWCKFDRRMPEW